MSSIHRDGSERADPDPNLGVESVAELGNRLRYTTDAPLIAVGRLPEVRWGVAIGPGPRCLGVHVVLAWTPGGSTVVNAGTRGASAHRRFFTWRTDRTIAAIELDTLDPATHATTTAPAATAAPAPIRAVLLHDDPDHQLRVFLAVIEDSAVVLRAARRFDAHRRLVDAEDLREDQERFETRIIAPTAPKSQTAPP